MQLPLLASACPTQCPTCGAPTIVLAVDAEPDRFATEPRALTRLRCCRGHHFDWTA